MQHQQEQQKSQNGPTNAEDLTPLKEVSSNLEGYREELEGSPFHIIGNDNNGYYLALGRYILSERQETPQAVKDYLINNHWNISFRMDLIQGAINEEIRKSTLANNQKNL